MFRVHWTYLDNSPDPLIWNINDLSSCKFISEEKVGLNLKGAGAWGCIMTKQRTCETFSIKGEMCR